MARNDKILQVFLSDPLIKDKYSVDASKFQTVESALQSKIPIVRAIAMIIDEFGSEKNDQSAIYQHVISYLNKVAE